MFDDILDYIPCNDISLLNKNNNCFLASKENKISPTAKDIQLCSRTILLEKTQIKKKPNFYIKKDHLCNSQKNCECTGETLFTKNKYSLTCGGLRSM